MLDKQKNVGQPAVVDANDDDIRFGDLVAGLVKYKRILIGFPIITTLAAVVAVLITPPTFQSTAVILPPQQQTTGVAAAMLGQLGLTGSGLGGIKNPVEMYIGMLNSRTIADAVATKNDLRSHYDKETLYETRIQLKKNTTIDSGRDGMIKIEVEDGNPQKAADVANAYVAELAQLTQKVALTEAAKRRAFFETQLKSARQGVADAELALQEAQKKAGGKVIVTTAPATPESMEVMQRLRDVKYNESVVDLLVKQYDLARVDEAKDASLIQQLDIAQPAELKSKPNGVAWIILGLIAGLVLGIATSIGQAYLAHVRGNA